MELIVVNSTGLLGDDNGSDGGDCISSTVVSNCPGDLSGDCDGVWGCCDVSPL